MSVLARNAVRAVVRSGYRARYSTQSEANTYVTHYNHIKAHAKDTTHLWRKISYFFCFPAVAVCVAWVYNVESEHAAHAAHIREEHDGHLAPVPDYEYMNKRAKPYPWGYNSLFFNPHNNRDMNPSE